MLWVTASNPSCGSPGSCSARRSPICLPPILSATTDRRVVVRSGTKHTEGRYPFVRAVDSSDRGVASAGGIEESPTVAAVQDGHFAEPPRHDRTDTKGEGRITAEPQKAP